VWEIISYP